MTSTQEVLGKPIGSDAKNQKTTYVSWKGIGQARAEVERLSQRAVSRINQLVVRNEFLTELMLYLIHREK